jgi:hypothetical protein
MRFLKKYSIAILVSCSTLSFAKIDYFLGAQLNESYIGFENKLKLIPGNIQSLSYWSDQATLTPFRSGQLSISGHYELSKDKGFIGHLGYAILNKTESLTGVGSYEIEVERIASIGASGYYKTKSGSLLAAGLKLSAPKMNISSRQDGLLFNDHTPSEKSEITPTVLLLQSQLSIPLTSSFDAYIGGEISLNTFGVELDSDPNFSDANSYALVAQSTTPMPLSRQISTSPSILMNAISFGIKTHVYTQQ